MWNVFMIINYRIKIVNNVKINVSLKKNHKKKV